MRMQAALPDELVSLWPAVRAAHLFADRDRFERFYADAPWRVVHDREGKAAVLERWREHLDILWARGVWAGDRDVAWIVRDLREIAARQGFSRVLSPLLATDAARAYERAGLEPLESIVALRIEPKRAAALGAAPPDGVEMRRGTSDDIAGIVSLDSEAFDEFWAYGEARIERAIAEERLVIAHSGGRVFGYTLSTIERGSGTLARIAVGSEWRGRGIGGALLSEALAAMAHAGADSISLCTQQANAEARALYASVGMREMPGRLCFLVGDA